MVFVSVHLICFKDKYTRTPKMPKTNPVSRLEFLKLVGTAGTAFMLLPLVPLGRALAQNVTMTSKPLIIKRVTNVGRDGVAFLYPTKP
jgi:hypothetical protein